MLRTALAWIAPVAVGVAGVLVLGAWLEVRPGVPISLRLPTRQELEALEAKAEKPVDLTGFFQQGEGEPSDIGASWPQFRGPRRDGVIRAEVALRSDFSAEDPPPELWRVEMGQGYAGAAVHAGRVYVLDYDEELRADVLRCLSLDDGREIWHRGYHVDISRQHGVSRTVPAVTDEHVVTIGPKCHVLCAEAKTGDLLWAIDLVKEYGTKTPAWYTAQCPLIDRGRAILAPAGPDVLMLAVDLTNGEVVWKASNPRGWQMTHSSIMPMDLDGRRTYVYAASGGAGAVDAETGEIVWLTDRWKVNMATSPSPIVAGPRRVLFVGGYGSGAMMARLDGEPVEVVEQFRLKPNVFGSEQQTPILHEGHVYGLREDGQLVCVSLDGEMKWQSGRLNRFGPKGRGPYIIADGKLILLTTDGTLHFVQPTGEAFRPLGSVKVMDGFEAWAPLALADGRLILRDLTTMVCLDLRKK